MTTDRVSDRVTPASEPKRSRCGSIALGAMASRRLAAEHGVHVKDMDKAMKTRKVSLPIPISGVDNPSAPA